MQACLRWDPKERLTPEEALQHTWTQTVDPPAQPAPSQPLAPAAVPGWSPRINPASTSWLSVSLAKSYAARQLVHLAQHFL